MADVSSIQVKISARVWPPKRSVAVETALKEAVKKYAEALDSEVPIRCIQFDVKLRHDRTGVRTVLVTLQGESEDSS